MTMIEDNLHPLKASFFHPVPLSNSREFVGRPELPVPAIGRDAEGEVGAYGDDSMGYTDLMNGHGSGSPTSPGEEPDDCADSEGENSSKGSEHSRRQSDKKLYNCQHCKYVTDRKNNLKRHVVTMHDTCPKVLECCDHIFKNKASLREHVLSCHKNGYDCRICGRNFCRKALLKRHVTVHSGQKDYICNVCGYATSHKSNLDRHRRRHDSKYPCEDDKAPLGSAKTFDILRFLPSGFPCPSSSLDHYGGSPLSPNTLSPSHLSGVPLAPMVALPGQFTGFLCVPAHEDTALTRPYWPLPHRQRASKSLFTKRLVCTHPQSEPTKDNHSSLYETPALPTRHTTSNTPNQGENDLPRPLAQVQSDVTPSERPTSPCPSQGDECENLCVDDDPPMNGTTAAMDLTLRNLQESGQDLRDPHGTSPSKPGGEGSSRKRLVPRLYECRPCGTVYGTQLDFAAHQDRVHPAPVGLPPPQRPLTILARPDSWFTDWPHIVFRADSRFTPSRWETVLLCNDVSHWLGSSLESAVVLQCLVGGKHRKCRWPSARLQYLQCVSNEDTVVLH